MDELHLTGHATHPGERRGARARLPADDKAPHTLSSAVSAFYDRLNGHPGWLSSRVDYCRFHLAECRLQ